jgi:hypothetical protein
VVPVDDESELVALVPCGFFFVPAWLEDVVLAAFPLVPVDWLFEIDWFAVEVEFTSVEVWLALTPLFTDWLPLPTLMPGLTLAPRFTSVLLMFAFASTPTFGFTFSVGFTPRPLPVLEVAADGVVAEAEPEIEPLRREAGPPVPEAEPLIAPVAPPLVVAPVIDPVVPLLLVLVVALEALSSRQSWCTGLAECSFARPVSLSASLPALGFL